MCIIDWKMMGVIKELRLSHTPIPPEQRAKMEKLTEMLKSGATVEVSVRQYPESSLLPPAVTITARRTDGSSLVVHL